MSPTVRGRPRSERARQASLAAAAGLLYEGGMAAVTMEAIAARAGVSKVTLYRWWPNCRAVALDGFFDVVEAPLAFHDTGDVERDLTDQLTALIELFTRTPAGPSLAGIIGQAQSDPDLAQALRDRWLAPRRRLAAEALAVARERGQLRADADDAAIIDQVYGPVYHRLLLGHEPLTPQLAPVLVRQALRGAGPGGAQ